MGVDVNSDVRVASMMLFNGLGVYELVSTLYPRMIAVTNMPEDVSASRVKVYLIGHPLTVVLDSVALLT